MHPCDNRLLGDAEQSSLEMSVVQRHILSPFCRNIDRQSQVVTVAINSSRRKLPRQRRYSLPIMTMVAFGAAMASCELLPSAYAFASRQPPASSSSKPSRAGSATRAAASTSDGIEIEGMMDDDEFDRCARIDATVRAIREQLPTLLTKPLTASSTADVYTKDNFRLNVLVEQAASKQQQQQSGAGSPEEDEIIVLNSRDELVALSDVLVLATTATRQASAAITGGTADTQIEVQCQLILDDSLEGIRIPWKARAPLLGSPDSSNNLFEGITDFRLNVSGDDDDEDFGKVRDFTIRKVTWNGRALNGPAIGQAVKAIQSTVTNLQQSPILQNIARAGDLDRTANFLTELRDGLLGQAATALSASSGNSGVNSGNTSGSIELATVPVYQVKSINEISGWIEQSPDKVMHQANGDSKHTKLSTGTACPGTKGWMEYASSRECLLRFCDEVIPQLSDLSIVDSSLFSKDANLITTDGSTVITGQEPLANFYQSMALTRTGTGGSFKATRYQVVDWANRTIAVHYEATISSLPLWTIQGCDVFSLDLATTDLERPVIRQIRQSKMIAVNPAGNNEISIDGQWMMKNLVAALDDDGSAKASRDFWTELLMQQPGLSPLLQASMGRSKRKTRKKLSEAVAAKSYYIMTDLYDHGAVLFDLASSRTSAPGAEYVADNVELRGYLGESILRGSTLYNRSIGSVLLIIRDAIRQKRIVVEKLVPPRVELIMPAGDVRLSLTFVFRIPQPGAGIILPGSAMGPPIKLEWVSEYKIDADTGSIVEHRLVETRVNDQLTPGDQVSRWIQRFLKMDGAGETGMAENINGDTLKAISEALSWIRSLSSPNS